MITFIKQRPGNASDYLVKTINNKLISDEKILWFLSGGSSISLAIAVRKRLERNLKGLTVMLIDERYGPDNHPASNWKQLKDAGGRFDSHVYPGGDNAFMNDDRPEVYDAPTAQDAWQRALDFFNKELSS